ncbi:UDP-N-acetylmuramate dehydrogenase [Pseudobutyrivibrio xylanivorans]|uniref:UDP-N-acetylenolpyruvoylglucosamine reductase n=1 Tax=Pseudobutyrivibrio xylanivorans TaxID=185007 RepID=A0A1G5RTI4_PSEXY|nr:UDP-N-acetylmuramate dehydrogenase [Pseudobutyrivibrio xylanivorans]SCZ76629.1 UDP-N-acetylmuramate dehydrogenase [Pseudobutyrivibrio xylanivorans]
MHNSFSKKDFYNELQKRFPEVDFIFDEPMKKHTTFRIGGPADIYVEPSVSQVVPLIAFLKEADVPFMVIGNGSNLLVSDDGIEGVVVAIGKAMSEIIIDEANQTVTADAGAMLSSVANRAADAGLTGLEFASGIPGTIGGAVYMNAGAYGGEMKDVITSVQILKADGAVEEVSVDKLDLSYRHSALMENTGFVLSAKIQLAAGNVEEIKATIDDIRQKRIDKQPLNFPSAGSTFKRPEGYFAGKLIDDTGLRGYTVGGAQVSEKHCGFVINKSDATASDVLKLMKDVDEKVYEKFGVHLTPEVRIIGRNVN